MSPVNSFVESAHSQAQAGTRLAGDERACEPGGEVSRPVGRPLVRLCDQANRAGGANTSVRGWQQGNNDGPARRGAGVRRGNCCWRWSRRRCRSRFGALDFSDFIQQPRQFGRSGRWPSRALLERAANQRSFSSVGDVRGLSMTGLHPGRPAACFHVAPGQLNRRRMCSAYALARI